MRSVVDSSPRGIGRLGTIAAILVTFALFVAPIGLWPWDHDEVATFGELGIVAPTDYPEPVAQLERMPRLVPVWHVLQNAALRVVPHNEWGARLLPSICGALAVIAAFLFAGRTGRPWLAWSMLLMMAGSQSMLWLSQQNRFYPMAMLWVVLTLALVWARNPARSYDAIAALTSVLAVLSHNLTAVIFGIGAVAAIACLAAGRIPRIAARRAVICGAAAGLVYLLYLRPLIAGWASGNTGGTQPLVSLLAQIGVVPIALAAFAGVATLFSRSDNSFEWWILVALLGLIFVAVSPWVLGNWNPRYALFFMLPIWVLAAHGCAVLAEAAPSRAVASGWLVATAVMLLPKLASHFVDGSRHDLRSAAVVVAARAPDVPVLSNWPAELQWYLQPLTGQRAGFWYPGERLPSHEAVVVIASNAWDPVLSSTPETAVSILGEIRRRRFDEQSHVVRVYLVSTPHQAVRPVDSTVNEHTRQP